MSEGLYVLLTALIWLHNNKFIWLDNKHDEVLIICGESDLFEILLLTSLTLNLTQNNCLMFWFKKISILCKYME
ncbi:hypothetical protein SUGI_1201120 [Cryptomeria japonica]|nr:hypothetical protein SUGI_1201120 [Cryptomeria japonica]